MSITALEQCLNSGGRAHLVGIGGVSMSALAEVLKSQGIVVTGSDSQESRNTRRLRESDIPVTIGHFPETVSGASYIIRTAAVRDDNVEIKAARAAGIPVFERAEAWGYIMRAYANAVCIAGTHGKTTTTSMSAHIFLAAKADPTVMVGGTLSTLNAAYRVGEGDTIILESCEYYNSFLNFSPTVAVILNIEADHLDFFKDLEDIKKSFRTFAELVPAGGCVVYNADDENTMDAMAGLKRPVLTFGLGEGADVRAKAVSYTEAGSEFDVTVHGKSYCRVTLRVPGQHNVMNALAAIAAAYCVGVPGKAVEEGLNDFCGAGRRFEYKGTFNGARVYDDYAHHPSELKALLDAVAAMPYRRTILVFQPHTYTRTYRLFDDFIEQLRRPDVLLLAEIYAAREKNTIGISSKQLAEHLPNGRYCATFDEIEAALRAMAREGDIILTVGAGDIVKVGERLVAPEQEAI
ncbi:MAG TPA: UDP-N-acetylmuramate--L-alanine ligase [Papillibacter sp.]|nr:UDP-N-acetylmuramate--L-alanine ligase [Papillibacter sp.]